MNRLAAVTVIVMFAGGAASAAELAGTVLDAEGRPLAGVFVVAAAGDRALSVAGITRDDGSYALPDLFPGDYTLSTMKFGYEPAPAAALNLSPNGGQHDFRLVPARDTVQQVPGNAWLAGLPDSPEKARFVTGCTICHDVGAEPVRRVRSRDEWIAAIALMREGLDVYSVIPDVDNAELADWLLAHRFGEKPAALEPPPPGANGTADVVATLYDVGEADSWVHDMIIEPATGAAWVGDYPHDLLIRVDPRTGAQTTFRLPVDGAGMHTLHFDAEGLLWITLQMTDMVASFDPRTETFRIYGGFQRGSLIHSFAYDEHGLVERDSAGRIWLSEFGSNAVASLNPDTGEVREYALQGEAGHTYGIALDSRERVWFTKYNENTYGYLDPATGAVVEKQMPRPHSAPHRMDIDPHDRLWIPNSGYGTLAMYDIATDTLREMPLPEPDTFPYAARYDGATDTVWVVGNGANALFRYHPGTDTFTTFRLPAQQAYGRMIAFDYATGDVWTALSNYPNKHTGRATGTLVRLQHVAPPRGRARE